MGNLCLRLAVRSSSKAAVKLFLRYGDVSSASASGSTALHLAFRTGNKKIIRLVLSADRSCEKNVNPVDDRGLSHFHAACTINDAEVVRAFLQNGVDVNGEVNGDVPEWLFRLYDSMSGSDGFHAVARLEPINTRIPASSRSWACKYTPLHFAVENRCRDVVDLLIDHGADVNAPSVNGRTPLHLACMHFDPKVMRTLIKRGANVGAKCKRGETPLHLAILYRNMEAVHSMLRYARDRDVREVIFPMMLEQWFWEDPPAKQIYTLIINHIKKIDPRFIWKLLLFKAARGNSPDRLRILIAHCDSKHINDVEETSPDRTLLHAAASRSSAWVTELLLRKGADVGLRDPDGGTVLHRMAGRPAKKLEIFPNFWAALPTSFPGKESSCRETTSTLLKYGCDLEAKDAEGKTPLHVAFERGNESVVRALLQHGADINAEDESGHVPFYYSQRSSSQVRCALEDHALKLKAIGSRVAKRNEVLLLCKPVQGERHYAELKERCASELERMREVRIVECSSEDEASVPSVHDFVFETAGDSLLRFIGDASFMERVESNFFKAAFPLYGYLVHAQVRKGYDRRVLLNARKFLVRLGLPGLCSDIVLENLAKSDYAALDKAHSLYL